MHSYIPTMYKKSVFDIPYDKLKQKKVKCLIFDLDNTLALINERFCPEEIKKLCHKLQKDFKIIIISNNNKKRIKPFVDTLDIEGISWAMKPFTKGLKTIQKKYQFAKEEMVMIGDQLMTDIVSGNRFKIMTILVDPLGKKDMKITSINRFFENLLFKYFSKKGTLKRGSYYEI